MKKKGNKKKTESHSYAHPFFMIKCSLSFAFAKETKDILTSKCLHEYGV